MVVHQPNTPNIFFMVFIITPSYLHIHIIFDSFPFLLIPQPTPIQHPKAFNWSMRHQPYH